MPNDMVTAGNRVPQVEFPSSVLSILWMCSLMDCCVWSQVIAFGGGPYRFAVFRAHLWQKKYCNTNFNRDSYLNRTEIILKKLHSYSLLVSVLIHLSTSWWHLEMVFVPVLLAVQSWSPHDAHHQVKEPLARMLLQFFGIHIRLGKSICSMETHHFPESVWAKGSSNSGGLLYSYTSSHFLIFSSSHLHIYTYHLLIFSSSHLLIFSSSHPLILSSSHPLILSSSLPLSPSSLLSLLSSPLSSPLPSPLLSSLLSPPLPLALSLSRSLSLSLSLSLLPSLSLALYHGLSPSVSFLS